MHVLQIHPIDVVVACKLKVTIGRGKWSYSSVSRDLGISLGGIQASVFRLREAGILTARDGEIKVARSRLCDLLTEAVPVIFFARRGEVSWGMPTSLAAEPLKDLAVVLSYKPDPLPLVWKKEGGKVKGESLVPIHKIVPEVAEKDAGFYELCALVDVIRTTGSTLRKPALDAIIKRVMGPSDANG